MKTKLYKTPEISWQGTARLLLAMLEQAEQELAEARQALSLANGKLVTIQLVSR